MNVTATAPIDIGGILDEACQAAVLLASSLGWKVIRKLNKPVILTAPDGTRIAIPTNTSVQFNVYRHWINSIYTHREDAEPTVELIDSISKRVKLSPPHRKVMYDGIAKLTGEPAAAAAPEPDAATEEPLDTAGTPATIVERKPLIARGVLWGPGKQHQTAWESDYVDTRLWSNGKSDYVCRWCNQSFTTAQLAGQHGARVHPDKATVPDRELGAKTSIGERMRAAGKMFVIDRETGERLYDLEPLEPKPDLALPKASPEIEPAPDDEAVPMTKEEWEPFANAIGVVQDTIVEHPPKVFADLADAEQKLAMIAGIVGWDPELAAENERLRARVAELEGALTALRDLIGGI